MKFTKSIMLVLFIISTSANLLAQKNADPVGTWSFHAPDADYEYSSGDIVIAKEGKEYTAKIVYGDYEIKGQDVVLDKDQLSFMVYIEGEPFSIKGTVTKEEITGKASYSEGIISFIAERKKEDK